MKNIIKIGLAVCLLLSLSGCEKKIASKIWFEKELQVEKKFTEVESITSLKDSNAHDYFIRYHPNEMYKYSLREFDKEGNFIEAVLIYDYTNVTKCGYLYFEKKWYIPNFSKGLCGKDKAKEEIEKIVDFMNPRIEEVNKNKKTWN